MTVLQEKIIESDDLCMGTLIIRLCGRKGSRYLEYEFDRKDNCWYLDVSDDVSLHEVYIENYDTYRGQVDSVTLNINGKEYLL